MAPVKGHRRNISVASAIAAFLLCSTCLPVAAAEKTEQSGAIVRRRAEIAQASNWPKYCASLSMNGVAAGERDLSTVTVPRLQLLWSRTLSGPIASEPSVARGKVYVGDWGGREWALDADTGALIASADLGQTKNDRCNPAVAGITSSPLIDGNHLYLAGGDDGFYALDADTLATVWRKSLGDNSSAGGYYGWCSPTLAGGKLLQGISSNCDNPFPRGGLAAIDPVTGEVSAITYFVPEGSVGGGVWTSAAVDIDHNKIFVTTGSADIFGVGDAYSIVRLDLDTLLIEDRWQLPANPDVFVDADWGSSPTLFNDAAGRELVGAGQKDGGYYVFDRNDLASGPIWVAPIAIGGEVPQNGEGTLSTAAFDGKTLYVGGGVPRDNNDPSVLGAVTALSPGDGTILWRHTFEGPVLAPVSFANGVVFAAGGKTVVALDAATGSVLWSFQMKAAGFGGIAIANGTAYVGDLFGTFYAFGLPGPIAARQPGRR
jgi:polyvinyl alcohol dehydrogenase (cytochrome)